jgi:hypothetical protein
VASTTSLNRQDPSQQPGEKRRAPGQIRDRHVLVGGMRSAAHGAEAV